MRDTIHCGLGTVRWTEATAISWKMDHLKTPKETCPKDISMEGQHPAPVDLRYVGVHDHNAEQYGFQDLMIVLRFKDYFQINETSSGDWYVL